MYWITALLGFVLVFSPFIFGYLDNSAATWTSIIFGSLVAFASIIENLADGKDKREYYLIVISGILIIISPFVFNFSDLRIAYILCIGIGIILAIAAGSKLILNKKLLT